MNDYDIVKSDFDEISELPELRWNHNNCYFNYLLKNVPENIEKTIEIGCGKGELCYLLSQKSKSVIGIDLSEKMIEKARGKYALKENMEFINGNILDFQFEAHSLDLIITTATAHHLPYEWLLEFAKEKLKDGGKLIILDLYKASSFLDYSFSVFAVIPNIIMNLLYNHSIKKDDPHSQEIWRKHGEHDEYSTLKEIKTMAKIYLKGFKIKRKLFWRYVLIWEKVNEM